MIFGKSGFALILNAPAKIYNSWLVLSEIRAAHQRQRQTIHALLMMDAVDRQCKINSTSRIAVVTHITDFLLLLLEKSNSFIFNMSRVFF